MADGKVLQCGIVGAGVAGLCAAIALRRAGHDVEVYERSHFKQEIGAAITLGPNANRVLHTWGFDPASADTTDKRQLRRLKWDTLEVLYQESYDHVLQKYGYPFNAFHRVDLHKVLREMATEKHGAHISLGMGVKEVDCKGGKITFENGETAQKDLVIIADGIRSEFTRNITGEDVEVKKQWGSVFRTIIPIDRLVEDESFRTIFENEPSGFLTSAQHEKVGFVTYPCRKDTLMNIAIFHSTLHPVQDANSWSNPATIEDVLGVLEGWPEMWRNMVKRADADAFKIYRVEHRAAIPTMVNSKACIIGDSAHGMMPTYAQGGCMAIEDAAALEILLSNMEVTDGVDNRLKLWNQMRLPRCAATQFLSNRMYKDTAERDEGVKQFYAGPLPDANISGWSDPWNDVFYGYNAFEQARKALEYKDAKDGLPDGAVEVLGAYGGEKAKTDIQLKDDSHFFQSGSLHSGQPKTTPGKVNFNSISNTS